MGNMSQILGSNPLIGTMMNQGVPLDQRMTPAANNFQPDMQVPPVPPMPNKSPMSAMGPMPQSAQPLPQQKLNPQPMKAKPNPGMPEPGKENEAQSIIRVLGERLMTLTRMEEKQHAKATSAANSK